MDSVDVALTNERNGYSAFNADYTPPPEAIAKVNGAFAYIEEFPEKWDQAGYGNHLTDENCFMGIVCRLSGLITNRFSWHEDNGNVPEDFHQYALSQAMDILGMGSYEYMDRAEFIAEYIEVPVPFDPKIHEYDGYYPYRPPTLDEMRERVSIAMNHDFRKPSNNVVITDEGDPTLTN